jgi:hypothetical protein
LLALLITTSTTGYAALAIGGGILCLHTLSNGSIRKIGRLAMVCSGFAGLALFALSVAIVAAPDTLRAADTIIDATLSKGDSSSYIDRTTADLDSLSTLIPTFGLGTGWGSNRASSLFPGLLSTIGLPGLIGITWFAAKLFQGLRSARLTSTAQNDLFVLDATAAGLVAVIVTNGLSGSDVSSTHIYLLLALQISTLAAIQYRSRDRRMEAQNIAGMQPSF